MEKRVILENLINALYNGNKAQFAYALGVKPQTISTWITRNTFDIDLVYAKCEGISGDWLLSGKGNMFRCSQNANTNNSDLIALCKLLVENYQQRDVMMNKLVSMVNG